MPEAVADRLLGRKNDGPTSGRHDDIVVRRLRHIRDVPRPVDHDVRSSNVADVLAGGVNVGAAMDAAGWSKADCPKR